MLHSRRSTAWSVGWLYLLGGMMSGFDWFPIAVFTLAASVVPFAMLAYRHRHVRPQEVRKERTNRK